MKLPNGEQAIVDIERLQDACLSPHHPVGRHKARVFASAGIRREDAEMPREALFTAAAQSDAIAGGRNEFGARYVLDFELVHLGRTLKIRIIEAVADLEQHSVVALLEDLPQQGVERGQVGVIVGCWAPGVYEVEFADTEGRTYALVTLKIAQLMVLHHKPTHKAA